MRRILWLVGLLSLTPAAWAGRVCLERGTGKLIEYQSRATPGTLLRNAEAAGYAVHQIEEREVTDAEWATMREAQIDAPARAAREADRQRRRQLAATLQQKLGLTAKDFQDLREALTE